MYVKYNYTASPSQANLLADIVSILTGTTDINTLSATCQKGKSELLTTVAAGWVVHDAAAGTNVQVLKAALADSQTTFKFIWISTNTTGKVIISAYESWDAGTHTGTNQAINTGSSANGIVVDTTNGGTLLIASSARFVLMNGISSTGSYSNGIVYAERSRTLPWDTLAAGWPPTVWCNGGWFTISSAGFAYASATSCNTCRMPNAQLNPLTGSSAYLALLPQGFVYPNTNESKFIKMRDASGGDVVPMYPLAVMNQDFMPAPYGDITSVSDVWMVMANACAPLDVISKSSIEYVVVKFGTSVFLAVRRG